MKGILFFTIISCVMFTSCMKKQESNNLEKQDVDNKKKDKIVDFLNKSYLNVLSNDIFIIDTMGKINVNIPVKYETTNRDWEKVVGFSIFYELYKMDFTKYLVNDSDKFDINIVFNFTPNNVASFECSKSANFDIYTKTSKYGEFSKYVIENMSPLDFSTYNVAFKQLFKDTGDKCFKRSFYNFFVEISQDEFLDHDEKYILTNLIEWAKENPETEITDHFEYFINSLEEEIEVKVESHSPLPHD